MLISLKLNTLEYYVCMYVWMRKLSNWKKGEEHIKLYFF